jgi:cellulose biosynthesis protein BcsQ
MGTPEVQQKSILNTSKLNKNKDTYGFYPTKFARSTQKHKKVIETQNQPIEIKKISNKSMFSTSKVKRRQKFVWKLPDRVCRLNPKS